LVFGKASAKAQVCAALWDAISSQLRLAAIDPLNATIHFINFTSDSFGAKVQVWIQSDNRGQSPQIGERSN
jgi:hypothetical protein